MPLTFTLSPFECFTYPTRTRLPFRYGIATMTEVPHLFLRTRVRTSNSTSSGLASEGLAPKWFTKNPATTFEQDLPEMYDVILHAASAATEISDLPITFGAFWRELCQLQESWAQARGICPLLAHLGVSLCERAVLDGLCRASSRPLHQLILENQLDLPLGELCPELGRNDPRNFLPTAPRPVVHIRHTIGLGDPLSPAEIPPGNQLNDGLPEDLETSVGAYGLTFFKIKLTGNTQIDIPRLRAIGSILKRSARNTWRVTLDGNENFKSFEDFRVLWAQLESDPSLRTLRSRVLLVEQPVHRDHALSDDAGRHLADWPNHPPVIIDESDGDLADLPRALELGYAGTSHKNCKGLVKGLRNACLLEHLRRRGRPVVLTGEDLCNLGPVALLQDLAMMALFGIEHVERNGHHYFRGLSMWPAIWQESVLAAHPDLFARHRLGFAALLVEQGRLRLESVNAAPFGIGPVLDPSGLSGITSLPAAA